MSEKYSENTKKSNCTAKNLPIINLEEEFDNKLILSKKRKFDNNDNNIKDDNIPKLNKKIKIERHNSILDYLEKRSNSFKINKEDSDF